jgi:hypothetical protein
MNLGVLQACVRAWRTQSYHGQSGSGKAAEPHPKPAPTPFKQSAKGGDHASSPGSYYGPGGGRVAEEARHRPQRNFVRAVEKAATKQPIAKAGDTLTGTMSTRG